MMMIIDHQSTATTTTTTNDGGGKTASQERRTTGSKIGQVGRARTNVCRCSRPRRVCTHAHTHTRTHTRTHAHTHTLKLTIHSLTTHWPTCAGGVKVHSLGRATGRRAGRYRVIFREATVRCCCLGQRVWTIFCADGRRPRKQQQPNSLVPSRALLLVVGIEPFERSCDCSCVVAPHARRPQWKLDAFKNAPEWFPWWQQISTLSKL